MVFFIGYSTRYPFGELVLKRQYGERWNCCRFNKQNNSFVHALSGAFLYPPFKVTAWNFLMWRVPVDEKITTTNIIFLLSKLECSLYIWHFKRAGTNSTTLEKNGNFLCYHCLRCLSSLLSGSNTGNIHVLQNKQD